MPPINAKVEAQRLQQAKSVIKKMKQKRTEGNRVQMRKTVSAEKGSSLKDDSFFIDVSNETSRNERFNSAHDLSNGKKKEKQSPSGRIRKKVSFSSKIKKEVSTPENKSDPAAIPGEKEVKVLNNLVIPKENGDSHFLFVSPRRSSDGQESEVMQYNVDEGISFDSPYLRPSNTGKVYKPKKKMVSKSSTSQDFKSLPNKTPVKPQNTEEPLINILSDSNGLSNHSKKLKVKQMKRLNRGMFKAKKHFAPMSIRMKSGIIKSPIFTVTQDESFSPDDSRGKETLRAQVSRLTVSDSNLSAFSVTTVSDKNLPTEEFMDDEDNSDSEMLSDESQPEEEERLSNAESVTSDFDNDEPTAKKLLPFSNDWSKAEFHFIDDHVVLHLKHSTTFVFCGQVQFEVLMGTVEILGHRFTPGSGCHTAFSARGSSLLSVQTVLANNLPSVSSVLNESCSLSALVSQGVEGDAIILLKKSENTLPQFLEQFVEVKLFPSLSEKVDQTLFMKASKKLQCLCYPPSGSHIYRKGEDWDNICENISQQSGSTVICGGKGVGKSTMLRFLLNRLLSCGNDKVLLIDFDPGQTELTVPGCVSISLVDKPLLGPNFTHLQEPLKCVYIGEINVSNCVSRYMDACFAIINYWQSQEYLKEIPCVVNTMGFNKGLGVSIMVQILALLQPSNVIQIQSKFNSRNYPEQFTVEYVKRMCSSSPFRPQVLAEGQQLSCPSTLNYVFHTVTSVTDTMSEHCDSFKGITARPAREIVILSYLSNITRPPNFSLLETTPYCCPLEALYLNVCHENLPPAVTLSTFNASLVALCSINPEEENITKATEPGFPSIINGRIAADCLGFGIVRGIDMEAQNLYLLTPVPPNVLDGVNCLVLGSVCLPQSIYLTPSKEPGLVPYVVTSDSQHAAQPSKRAVRFNRLIGNA